MFHSQLAEARDSPRRSPPPWVLAQSKTPEPPHVAMAEPRHTWLFHPILRPAESEFLSESVFGHLSSLSKIHEGKWPSRFSGKRFELGGKK